MAVQDCLDLLRAKSSFFNCKLNLKIALSVYVDKKNILFKVQKTKSDVREILRALRRSTAPFCRDTSASTAIEFALLALPAIATIVGILGLGLYFLYAASLDHAVTVTARAISIGAVSSSKMSLADLKANVVCPALISSMNCSSVSLNITTVPTGSFPSPFYNFVNSKKSGLTPPNLDNSKNSFCPGAGTQYVVVELAYPVPVFANFLTGGSSVNFNGTNVNVLVAASIFLSEPYVGAASYTGC